MAETRRTGANMAFLINGTAVLLVREGEYEEEAIIIDSTAAGDPVEDGEPVRTRFNVRGRGLVQVASPYVIPNTIVGTKSAFALKPLSTDVIGIVSGQALWRRFRLAMAYDQMMTVEFEGQSAGQIATWDLSPAS